MATSGSKSVKVTNWDTLKFTWTATSQSIEDNTTTVSWKMQLVAGSSGKITSNVSKTWSVTVDGKKFSGTNTIGIANNATKTLASGTKVITHNDDGTKTFSYSFKQQFSGLVFSGVSITDKSGSGTGVLDTIPRKSTLSASNGTLGVKQTLTVDKKADAFTHTITYKCGSASGTLCTKASYTGIPFNPPLVLASQNTTGSSVSITFTIETFNGDTSLGTNTKTITCAIPASVKPTCLVNVSDAMGYLNTYGSYIKGLSKFKVSVVGTPAFDSGIVSYKANANGANYTKQTFETDVLKSHGTLKVTASVTDKRGRTSDTATTSVSVIDYAAPAISKLSVQRCNQDGTENDQGEFVQVTFSATVTSLDGKNTAAYTLKHQAATASSPTTVNLTDLNNNYSVTDYSYIFAADTGSSYNIELTVADAFKSAGKTTSASTAFTLMHWLASGLGMAIGKIAELANVFDIGFQTRFSGGILHPVLKAETDLNDVRTPNTYVGANTSTYNYANCPIDSGTFTLIVEGAGEAGQVRQKLISCKKADSRTFERFYYTSAWGEWVCTSDYGGTLLWSGNYYMTEGHTANLAEPISKQRSGIVLVFARYTSDDEAPYAWHSFFIPKYAVDGYNSSGHTFFLTTNSFSVVGTKYLYVRDEAINGNENNSLAGTANGITFNNNAFTLRYVIGV